MTTAPAASVEEELTEFEEVARAQVNPARAVAVARRSQVHVVSAYVERAREVFIEEVGQPFPGRASDDAAEQVNPGGAVERTLSRLVRHRQVERVLVPVGLRRLALHVVFVAGRVVIIVIAGKARRH